MDEFTKAGPIVQNAPHGVVHSRREIQDANPARKIRPPLSARLLLKEAEEDLLRKAIAMAKAGDGPMLKFLLDRTLPKERCIELPPTNEDCDPVERCEAIVEAVSAGRITPNEAASLVNVAGGHARIIDFSEVDERLQAIEKQLEALKET